MAMKKPISSKSYEIRGRKNKNNIVDRPSFLIDFENNRFLLDGKPFRYVSGSFHYFRTPRQYWRDRLRKLRAGGLNAVSTYVEWSLHQPEVDKWVWDGDADLVEFIRLAQAEDLLVLLRPGPYICAERDFGGFPYWLLREVPDIKLRTNDLRYLKYAEEYLKQVLTRVQPLLRGNGGPIIMVQVENEYGSFGACDIQYRAKLKNIMKSYVKDDAILYTTDGSWNKAVRCGSVAGAYSTVDFGTSANVTQSFKVMRQFEPRGPLVNSEFYPGWLSHWEEPFQRVDTGANIGDYYTPDLTSYDYDAPLTEAGDPTPKYFEIRKTISKYLPLPDLPTPTVSQKGDYGLVQMKPIYRLLDPKARKVFGVSRNFFREPPTFEALGLTSWIVLYEGNVPTSEKKGILKAAPKDRALVYLDGKLAGTLSRTHKVKEISLAMSGVNEIKILVENQGRVNFGDVDVEDFKGIFNITLNSQRISPWNVTGYKFDSLPENLSDAPQSLSLETETLHSGPQVLISHFEINEEPRDTYLNTAEWGKGIAFVNNHNLGRYWPLIGPQLTLYVPGAYLKRGKNTLVLVELEYVPKHRQINFQTTPILDYP
ncbi:hypothetical protein QAD02_005796 [Eretmocerus hayati]|uniref:Uncharacterized protein n=1 Tax=Eretmocerus hayati TaxID=131215 RepID=A0ACC2NTW6_9HYME|nr:hypothetical protein QAD02_005796 [Eretmocerus hayati]